MKIKVEVTQEDIDNGKPYSQCACPIARAISRLGYEWVNVRSYEIAVHDICANHTKKTKEFIKNFDKEETRPKCRPFTFQLYFPFPIPV